MLAASAGSSGPAPQPRHKESGQQADYGAHHRKPRRRGITRQRMRFDADGSLFLQSQRRYACEGR
jgi:hypothetical protein